MPVWVQLKREGERARKARNQIYRDMPTMPFDLWYEMKHLVNQQDNDNGDRPTEEQALTEKHFKTLYRAFCVHRKQRLRRASVQGISSKVPLGVIGPGLTVRESGRPRPGQSPPERGLPEQPSELPSDPPSRDSSEGVDLSMAKGSFQARFKILTSEACT
jgi:hypothetical protein